MKVLATTILAAALAVGVTWPAAAYIGPGAGLSLLGAFWGLMVAVMAALGFVILWPIRRLFRRNRTTPPVSTHAAGSRAAGTPAEGTRAEAPSGAD